MPPFDSKENTGTGHQARLDLVRSTASGFGRTGTSFDGAIGVTNYGGGIVWKR